MGNTNTRVANVSEPDQTNMHANSDVNEEEYYTLKLEELAKEKLSLFACEEDDDVFCEQVKKINKPKKLKDGTKRKRSSWEEDDDVFCEQVKKIKKPKKLKDGTKRKCSSWDDQDGKKLVGREIVSNEEVMTELREFIDEIKGSDMKLVIQKPLFKSDLLRTQNRLNMPFKQVETHDFLTDEEKRYLNSDDAEKEKNSDDAEIDVYLVGPNLQMFEKPMRLKIWKMSGNRNYVFKTNWCDFVKANEEVLKEKATIQVWSFRKDKQLCFGVVCVDKPVMTLEEASYALVVHH